MNAKMDKMMEMFQHFVLPGQKALEQFIEEKGGAKACQSDDRLLNELSEFEKKQGRPSSSSTSPSPVGGLVTKTKDSLDDLKEDLHTDPEVAMEKNMVHFSRKFEIQKRQIIEELSRVVRREGDRIISAVTSGPHDKINDPDVYRIWKEMNWRGSVKARHFVMTLRDYFHEKWGTDDHGGNFEGKASATHTSLTGKNRADDSWALAHLNMIKLQPISEAFDDDASGFITVAEVNTFTTSRPLGWSLPHWVAYWAVGWHRVLLDYGEKIRVIVGKMFAVLPTVRMENRNAVNDYFEKNYMVVFTIINSIDNSPSSDALRSRFQSYVDSEEERLRVNLHEIGYDIDDMETLALVTGPGRIEKFVLPVLYLLLKRHFEIFRIAKLRILHPDELWDAADTVMWVFKAVVERFNVLESVFKQQKLDVKQQFKTFAHGLFDCLNEPSKLWAPAIVRKMELYDYPYDDTLEEQNIKADDICNHPLDQEDLDLAAYDLASPDELPGLVDVKLPLKSILGPWNGYTYLRGSAFSGMISFTLLPGNLDNEYQASARSNGYDFKISGRCSPGDTPEKIRVSFKRTFPARKLPQYWAGELDYATDTITGRVNFDEDKVADMTSSVTFIFKRTPPEHLCFRPPPATFEANKPRALWTFAISATRHYVRQQSWSWSFFCERRDTRIRFIHLFIRGEASGKPLNEAEQTELNQIRKGLTAADNKFYHSLAHYQIRITLEHGKVGCLISSSRYCDNCKGSIVGALVFCMDCQTTDTWDSVDLCDVPECVAAKIERDDLPRPHLPTHDLIKVKRVVHTRQVGQLERMAKSALERGRQLIEAERRCIACDSPVTQPCWYCVQCEGPFAAAAHPGL
ncbi:hypothetical protein JB92DRAFT_3101334 [Gautieria morchelliformis]|nr:hypothetical protein JB92DRAFT_3101334 [Gautieria morchelliformis]